MAEGRQKFDEDFRQGAVRIVRETGKPIAQVARDLGINEGTLGNWCAKVAGCAVMTPARLPMSGLSWSGCGGRMRSWRCSVMSSSGGIVKTCGSVCSRRLLVT